MKKYTFRACKHLHEKPTEPNYIFTPAATAIVIAETEAEAKVLAEEKLRKDYHGSGMILCEATLESAVELAVDWNYGYGDERVYGDDITDMVGKYRIR